MITGRDVTRAVAGILEAQRAVLAAAIGRSGMPATVGAILPYWTSQIRTHDCPAIMVQLTNEGGDWQAMPDIIEWRYQLQIWGLVHWDDRGEIEDGVAMLAAAVAGVLNQRHRPIPLPDGRSLWFNDEVPVSRIDYGVAQVETAALKAFMAHWSGSVSESSPDQSGGEYA